jgi:hypothetical protein
MNSSLKKIFFNCCTMLDYKERYELIIKINFKIPSLFIAILLFVESKMDLVLFIVQHLQHKKPLTLKSIQYNPAYLAEVTHCAETTITVYRMSSQKFIKPIQFCFEFPLLQ